MTAEDHIDVVDFAEFVEVRWSEREAGVGGLDDIHVTRIAPYHVGEDSVTDDIVTDQFTSLVGHEALVKVFFAWKSAVDQKDVVFSGFEQ